MGSPQTASHLERYRFQPGQVANPAGRPKGSRHKLSETVIRNLLEDFEQHGKTAIEEVRQKRPEAYLACVCSLIPKQQEKVHSPLADIDDAELHQLEEHLRFLRAKTVEALATERPTTDALNRAVNAQSRDRSYDQQLRVASQSSS